MCCSIERERLNAGDRVGVHSDETVGQSVEYDLLGITGHLDRGALTESGGIGEV